MTRGEGIEVREGLSEKVTLKFVRAPRHVAFIIAIFNNQQSCNAQMVTVQRPLDYK